MAAVAREVGVSAVAARWQLERYNGTFPPGLSREPIMTLVKCSECGREVADRASSCPACGAPIQQVAKDPPKPEPPNVIERTSKKWVGLELGGAGIVVIGLATTRLEGMFWIGLLAIVMGIAVALYAWWHHG
jgi:zinc-ribbon domain